MKEEIRSLLFEELAKAEKAGKRLGASYLKAKAIVSPDHNYNDDELEVLESLSSRFARLSDILINKIFRLIERIDLDDSKTVRDSIILAEKKGLINSGEKLFEKVFINSQLIFIIYAN